MDGKFGDSDVWVKLPISKGLNNYALSNLREFRIVLPPLEIVPPEETVNPPEISSIKINIQDKTAEIEGTANPGVRVQIIVNDKIMGECYSKADGFFSAKNIPVHNRSLITCKAIDPAGREGRIGKRISIVIPGD